MTHLPKSKLLIYTETIKALNFLNGWNNQESAQHIQLLFNNHGTTLAEIHTECANRLGA